MKLKKLLAIIAACAILAGLGTVSASANNKIVALKLTDEDYKEAQLGINQWVRAIGGSSLEYYHWLPGVVYAYQGSGTGIGISGLHHFNTGNYTLEVTLFCPTFIDIDTFAIYKMGTGGDCLIDSFDTPGRKRVTLRLDYTLNERGIATATDISGQTVTDISGFRIQTNPSSHFEFVIESVTIYTDTHANVYGAFTTNDALAVLRHAAGIAKLDGAALSRLDVNGDGKVDTQDAVAILRIVAG